MNIEDLRDQITEIFKDLGHDLVEAERKALRNKANNYRVNDWKAEHLAYVVGSGALTGAIGGPVGLLAILPDLAWCKKVATQGCLGIGHIKGCDVDYDEDMNMILALWSGSAEASAAVPLGKAGIKVSNKLLPKVAGKVVEKVLFKGSSKMTAKIASKATTKLISKLMAKSSFGWIPIIGGAVSATINWWLLNGLLGASEKYYSSNYIIFNENEFDSPT